MSEHRSVLKSTSLISTLTILSRIFGYIRDSRINYLLGTGPLADAYTIAFRIPNTLRRLVGEGAVSAAFIPVFSGYLKDDKREEAWEFLDTLASAAIVLVTIIALLGIVLSPYLVGLFASDQFEANPDKVAATVTLNRIMFPYIAFVSLSALSMGILNSFNRFAASSFAPVMLNLSVVAMSFLAGLFSNPALALAVGVVIGGILQIAIQIPSLIRNGWRFRWLWNLAHPGVRRVGALLVPRIFGIGIVQIDVLVGLRFATAMIEGSAAAINTADRVMELVLGGYAVALSTAILPLLALQSRENRIGEMKNTISFALRLVLFITLPATVGLILLRRPIIEVLFQHGKFDSFSTELTAWPLSFFAIGLSAFAMMKIIIQAFYALHDTWTPVLVALCSLAVNIGLNFVFFRPLQNGGPALATSLAAIFDTIVLLIIFRKRHGKLGLRSVLSSGLRFASACVVMGLVVYFTIHYPGLYAGTKPHKALALAGTIALATVAYFGTARLLRAPELQEMGGIFAGRSARRADQ
jgi:putative peptidoglycan lipid II flippase